MHMQEALAALTSHSKFEGFSFFFHLLLDLVSHYVELQVLQLYFNSADTSVNPLVA